MDASVRHDSQLKVGAVRCSTAYRWRVAYKETRETMKRDRSINQEGRKSRRRWKETQTEEKLAKRLSHK